MLVDLICVALIVGVLFPKTPVGAALRGLFEAVAGHLFALRPGKALLSLLTLVPIVVAVIAVAQLLHGHAAVAMAAPDGMTWLFALDAATYIDVVAAVFLMAAAIRFRAAGQALRSMAARAKAWLARRLHPISSITTRDRAQRPRRKPSRHSGSGDDDRPAPGFVFA